MGERKVLSMKVVLRNILFDAIMCRILQIKIFMLCLIDTHHRQNQCQWGIYPGEALAIDIDCSL